MIRLGFLFLCLASGTLQQTTESVHIVKNLSLGFQGDPSKSTADSHTKKVLCMFDSWARDRKGPGKFLVEDIDANLCTHLVFRLVEIQNTGEDNYELKDNHATETKNELYRKAVGLKEKNPKLKVILSVGGWDEGVRNFQAISSNQKIRTKFAANVATYLKEQNFDGLNIEWVWPGPGAAYRGGMASDKNSITDLVTSLSKVLKAGNMELGVTLPADVSLIEGGYNIPAIESDVDFLIIMGQDLAGNWGTNAGHHSPLHGTNERNIASSVTFVLSKNIPPHKVILGISFVGRTFVLKDPRNSGSGLGAPTQVGLGTQGAFNTDDKVINYNEICFELTNHTDRWTVYEDYEAKVPFLKDGQGHWVSFEDPKSIQAKVAFGEKRGLGGYAPWSITTDDFKGNFCDGKVNYTLLRTINYALSKTSPSDASSQHLGGEHSSPGPATTPKSQPSSTTMNPISQPTQNSSSDRVLPSVIPGIIITIVISALQRLQSGM